MTHCRITEYDGAYKCWTHNRMWGAVTHPDEPCDALLWRIAELEQQLAAKDEIIECFEAMKHGVEIRIADLGKRIADLEAQLAAARASIERKQALLKRLEYIPIVPGWRMCPMCSGRERHMSDCALAGELKEDLIGGNYET